MENNECVGPAYERRGMPVGVEQVVEALRLEREVESYQEA